MYGHWTLDNVQQTFRIQISIDVIDWSNYFLTATAQSKNVLQRYFYTKGAICCPFFTREITEYFLKFHFYQFNLVLKLLTTLSQSICILEHQLQPFWNCSRKRSYKTMLQNIMSCIKIVSKLLCLCVDDGWII